MSEASPLPSGPFGCILADPPWAFNSWAHDGVLPSRTAASHYNTMTLEQMAALPVPAARDCALFMWVVDYHMPQALELGAAWGFTFKTCAFVWVKSKGEGYSPVPGMGYWTRKQTEQCWLFTRGSPKRLSKGVEQIIHCARGAHSAKPEQQYGLIERLVGGPYLELFARNTRPGWQSWGNQVGARDATLFSGVEA